MSTSSDEPGQAARAPVDGTPSDGAERTEPPDGVALCLSGGGFRAMLFHTGAIWRLNELGYLPRLDRVSSVSGGSITAALLGRNWSRLAFAESGVAAGLDDALVHPIRQYAGRTIDLGAVLAGLVLPGGVGSRIAASYRRHLFGGATLQSLPDRPRFVINATSLQSGVLWRFSKPYMWDYRVGKVAQPQIELAVAVAASSAFPPFLSPITLKLDSDAFEPRTGTDLQHPPFTQTAELADGGVYDNLGLETAWKRCRTVLVSDGGGHMGAAGSPHHVWPLQAVRVLGVIDTQVRSLRKRQVIAGYRAGDREGSYWGIRTQIGDYGLADALPCPPDRTMQLAQVATRLAKLPAQVQERLINWGYAVCDAAMRRHVAPDAPPPAGFPYPRAGV